MLNASLSVKLKLHLEQRTAMPVKFVMLTQIPQTAHQHPLGWWTMWPSPLVSCCIQLPTAWFCAWAASPYCHSQKCFHPHLKWLLNTCGTS